MERFKGVNELTIESGDMEDLLKKNEYLDMQDFVEEARAKDLEVARKRSEEEARRKRHGR